MLYCVAWGKLLGGNSRKKARAKWRKQGRNRKAGKRHPGGKLIQLHNDLNGADLVTRTSRQPHRREVQDSDRKSAEAESPIGRMLLNGIVDGNQYDAACYYAAAVGAYRSVIEAPKAIGGSGRGFRCAVEWGGTPAACNEEPETCSCRMRKANYDGAFIALVAVGQIPAKIVARVAVWRQEITQEQIVYLKAGLNALAKHFGLTRRAKVGYFRNTH